MKEYKYEELELINVLGGAKYCYEFMKAPEKELYFIYVNGAKFATFEDHKNALIIHDMMQNHFAEYAHIYEAQGMTIRELTPEQLTQVKQRYYTQKQDEKGEGVSWGELAQINDLVSDAEIYEQFEGVSFVPDDFT